MSASLHTLEKRGAVFEDYTYRLIGVSVQSVFK